MRVSLLLVTGVLLLCCRPVSAQDTQGRQPAERGGDTSRQSTGDSSGREVLTDALSAVMTAPAWNLGISIFGGYNQTNVKNTTVGGALGSFIRSGSTAGLTTRLTTAHSFRRVSFSLGGGTSSTYFRSTGRVITSLNGQSSQMFTLGQRTTLGIAEAAYYAPFYSLNQFPGLQTFAGTQMTIPSQPTIDTGIGEISQRRYSGQLNFSHSFTDRTSFTAQYAADLSSLGGTSARALFQQGGFRFNHQLSPGLGYYLGYNGIWASFSGGATSPVFHNLDLGLRVSKALSVARRTRVGFSAGTTMWRDVSHTNGGQSTSGSSSGSPRTRIQIIGQASLTHDIGRTWHARVAYNRNWQVIDGTFSAALGDAVSAGISGNLGRTTTAGATTSYLITGQQVTSGTARDQRAMVSGGFVNFVLNTSISGFLQVNHYWQEFDFSQTGLSLPSRFSRNSARAGLTISFRSR